MSEEIFTELLPNLYFVHGELGGRFPYCNGLMIDDEVKVLVDTGYGRSRIEAVIHCGLKVDVIINTHYHMDHVFGNKYFPQAKIWAHVLDAPALRSSEQFRAYTGLNETLGPDPVLFPGGPSSYEVDKELVDREEMKFGSVSLQVIHAPGHTPGHIALFEPHSGVLFSGDVDLSPFGPWYGNLTSDLEMFIESIRCLIKLNPKVLATSHSGIVTDNIPARLQEYLNKFRLREEQILMQLCVPKTIEELVDKKIIYRRFPDPQRLYRYFEEVMVRKHLEYLIKQGKVYESRQRFKAF